MTLGIMGWFHAIRSCRVHYHSITLTKYGSDERGKIKYLTVFTERTNLSPQTSALTKAEEGGKLWVVSVGVISEY